MKVIRILSVPVALALGIGCASYEEDVSGGCVSCDGGSDGDGDGGSTDNGDGASKDVSAKPEFDPASIVLGVRIYCITDQDVDDKSRWFIDGEEIIRNDDIPADGGTVVGDWELDVDEGGYAVCAGFIKADGENVLSQDIGVAWNKLTPDGRFNPDEPKLYGELSIDGLDCDAVEFTYNDGGTGYTSDWDKGGWHNAWKCK